MMSPYTIDAAASIREIGPRPGSGREFAYTWFHTAGSGVTQTHHSEVQNPPRTPVIGVGTAGATGTLASEVLKLRGRKYLFCPALICQVYLLVDRQTSISLCLFKNP